ncbi:hypothetical protein HSBAA_31640 [Vreelandella sulfidaeris]|uniref:dihydroorotase n=1 Tax=Vreelandella sulfidaeris TaxID=115553 RepID=A0A455UC30_9GAMM|nr:hypothetical protein HSBAA_31640 [Halomonas sulfidaeris]
MRILCTLFWIRLNFSTGIAVDTVTLIRPDDWHLHLRDDEALKAVVGHTAAQMGRAIIMPNLTPPITTTAQALEYRQRILDALPAGSAFEPLMVLYLTDTTPPEEIERAAQSGIVKAVKLYPAGATTNSDSGVTDLAHCDATIAMMVKVGMPCWSMGGYPCRDRYFRPRSGVYRKSDEAVAGAPPGLKVVFEHITTQQAAEFVAQAPDNVAATITAHHLLFNRNKMLVGAFARTITACLFLSASSIVRRY